MRSKDNPEGNKEKKNVKLHQINLNFSPGLVKENRSLSRLDTCSPSSGNVSKFQNNKMYFSSKIYIMSFVMCCSQRYFIG